MNSKLVITDYKNKRYGFLYEDTKLCEVHSFDDDEGLGNIYTGVVTNVVTGIGAAFVSIDGKDSCYYNIPDNEKRHIFLNSKKNNKLNIGDVMLVQLSKSAMKTKKAEVTADITFTGEYIVLNRSSVIGVSNNIKNKERREELKTILHEVLGDRLNNGYGAIIRTSAENIDNSVIQVEAEQLIKKMDDVISISRSSKPYSLIGSNKSDFADEVVTLTAFSRNKDTEIITDIPKIYERLVKSKNTMINPEKISLYKDNRVPLDTIYSIDKQVTRALSRKIFLKSGGYLIVDITEAMIVIDVNSGKSITGANKEAHILKLNIEAAEMIAYILRLKNLSGMILVDFINMNDKASENELVLELKKYLAMDTVKCNFVDITGLGLVEITRKKVTKPLHEIIS